MEGEVESSDKEEEEIEGKQCNTRNLDQPQVEEPNPNPPRRYPLRNQTLSRCFGNNVYDQ